MLELRVSILQLIFDARPIQDEERQSHKKAARLWAGIQGGSTHS